MRLGWLMLLLASGCGGVAADPVTPRIPGRLVEFSGICDASGAVVLSDTRMAVADDEDNVLRVFDPDRGGPPLGGTDISAALGLPAGKKGAPEADLEASTRLGDRAYWLTSHGRNKKGKTRPERLRFFATTVPVSGADFELIGKPYDHLIEDLIAEPALAKYGLAAAAVRPPQAPGGLNIEGLSASLGGGLLLGFRNPIPGGKALLVSIENPAEVVDGGKPRFGKPIELDLGGRGVRAIAVWRGGYVIAAGTADSERRSTLFRWDGTGVASLVADGDLGDLNPEAFFASDTRDEVLVISDDGTRIFGGTACKDLRDPAAKRFRALWVDISRLPGAARQGNPKP